jgi:hypothetical protein
MLSAVSLRQSRAKNLSMLKKSAKVDQDGSPLSGARVTGLNCTRWENDLLWQCQDLSEYGEIDLNRDASFLVDNIPTRIHQRPIGTPVLPTAYSNEHRLVMWETIRLHGSIQKNR